MRKDEFTRDVVSAWRRLRPNEDLTALYAGQLMTWIGRLSEGILERSAEASGLRRRGDYEVLAVVRRAEPNQLTSIEVADRLMTSPSGMTGKIDRLEARGLLERKSDEADRRIVRLSLTESGRALVEDAFTLSLQTHRRIVGDLSYTEVEALTELLARVLSTLDDIDSMAEPWSSRSPD